MRCRVRSILMHWSWQVICTAGQQRGDHLCGKCNHGPGGWTWSGSCNPSATCCLIDKQRCECTGMPTTNKNVWACFKCPKPFNHRTVGAKGHRLVSDELAFCPRKKHCSCNTSYIQGGCASSMLACMTSCRWDIHLNVKYIGTFSIV